MTIVWIAAMVAGAALGVSAIWALPIGTSLLPVPIVERCRRGPYRFLRHPMYVGNWLFIVGAAGMAGGGWNAFAVGSLAEMVLREWASRETGARS